jgi:hypothetical protein
MAVSLFGDEGVSRKNVGTVNYQFVSEIVDLLRHGRNEAMTALKKKEADEKYLIEESPDST